MDCVHSIFLFLFNFPSRDNFFKYILDPPITPFSFLFNCRTAHGGQSQVTLTGLLNALDGVVASEARLTFLTTNYPQRLDQALVRPGRVDLRLKIGQWPEVSSPLR